ncbi:alpha/beta hydrolase [Agromyces tardus]|jgi:pimeloyl-ACP methyl ester carboxylesterase|uniref:Alpha/beta hydrolase n=1 Tax=Agromyces tardus TaxID=2583849 RepID=A0A3M8AM19_9MICO|nr:alpha/beta hydrolase [Agromyces tardus]RNB52254.1 alpha/beta hydrolase [Agromyces tardus]
MSTLTDREQAEVQAANESGRRPVVFVHGLWLLSSSWQAWRDLFEARGYATLAPGWPDDPDSVEEARRDPEVFAKKMVKQVTEHYLEAIAALQREPAVVGHSFGGLIAQKIAGEAVASSTVSIDNAPFQGVLALPASSLKSASPVLANPANYGRAVSLTLEQFTYGWANKVDADEAKQLYETYHVPASGVPLFQAATANLNPFAETKVDTKNPERGPLLLISGDGDNTVPPAIVESSYKLQSRNPGVTEFASIPNRGHSLIIDSGWREVADEALAFVERYTPPEG